MVAAWAGSAAIGGMAKSLAVAYGAPATAKGIQNYFGTQCDSMKASENIMVARSGRVLEATALGYGIGYVAPVAIIAAGQLILGNPLSAISAVGSAAILANPVAATCAAIGAVYYGYNALTAEEKSTLVDSIAGGLNVGKQLIVSIIAFFMDQLKALLNNETLKQLKVAVGEFAVSFGGSIATVTRSLTDRARMSASQAYDGVAYLGTEVAQIVATTANAGTKLATSATEQLSDVAGHIANSASKTVTRVSAKALSSDKRPTDNDTDIP